MLTLTPTSLAYPESATSSACRETQSSRSIRSCNTHKQVLRGGTTLRRLSPIHQSLDAGAAGSPTFWSTKLITKTVREAPDKTT